MNEAIQSLLEHIGIDPFNHHHSDSVVQPKSKRPRKNKAVSKATVGPDAPADVPAHEEDDARGVHQEDPAGDAHEEEHAGGDHQEGSASDQEDDHGHEGEDESHHGLTMDESETSYWSGDFYCDYPHQTWSRFR